MRIRIVFSKSGSLRYTGHLDLHAIWERTVRRAGLPLSYTQGFHPGPRIQLAAALPLGFIGLAEIVDLWLDDKSPDLVNDLAEHPERIAEHPERVAQHTESTAQQPLDGRHFIDLLQPAAPPGLTILSVEAVDDRSPALQTQVTSAEYEAVLLDPSPVAEVSTRIQELLASQSLPRERRGKSYDLRPLVESLDLVSGQPQPCLHMRLAARSGATGRPEEVLDALGIPSESARITRTRLIL
jgi:uncharacterized protein (DUF2344 family)